MSKGITSEEKIRARRLKILQLLNNDQAGKGSYAFLCQQLVEIGCKVTERTVRGDCKSLLNSELVSEVKKGVSITEKGRDLLKKQTGIEVGIKKKYLKQIAVLRLLYQSGNRGMALDELIHYEAIGSNDTVTKLLQLLEKEGLIYRKKDRWYLSSLLLPTEVKAEEASRLYEYLNLISGIMPLPLALSTIKSKLMPLMFIREREDWREQLIKLNSRIIVHGRGQGEQQELARVNQFVEQAIATNRAVHVQYRGQNLKLYPLGLVYLWHKMDWYLVAMHTFNDTINNYRLDRIELLELLEDSFIPPENFDLASYMYICWGINRENENKVKVRFRETPWHITALDKVRGDLSRRHSKCKLAPQADCIIMEDKITGLNEFAAWVRSYGDAADVLEPESLRRKMNYTAKRMLWRYGLGECPDEQ